MDSKQISRIAKVFHPDYEWMNNIPDKRLLINPLLDVREDQKEKDELTEFYKLCNPFYSPAFGIKYLLGVKLFPFQMSMIIAMLRHKFPLLLLSRGAGKTFSLATYSLYHAIMFPYSRIILVSASFRQSKLVFNEMEKMIKKSPLLSQMMEREPVHNQDSWKLEICGSSVTALPMGDGCVSPDTMVTYGDRFGTISDDQPEDVDQNENIVHRNRTVWGNGEMRSTNESYYNRYTDIIKIRTSRGFEISGTKNHKVKIVRDGDIIWSRFDEITESDHVLIDRSIRWHKGANSITPDESYALGLIIGDGSIKDKYNIGFATKDQELAEAVCVIGNFVPATDGCHYNAYGKSVKSNFMSKFGVSYKHVSTKDKRIPESIMCAERHVVTEFIKGLMDSDGGVVDVGEGSTCVEFNNTSKILIQQLQYILLHYGIVATVYKRDRSEKWNTCYQLTIRGANLKIFHEKIGFRLSRKVDGLDNIIANKKRFVNHSDYLPDMIDKVKSFSKEFRAPRGSYNSRDCSYGYLKNKSNISWKMANTFLRVHGGTNHSTVKDIENLYDTNIFYDKVSDIEHDGQGHTYDIHVPNGHEYCANGFFSHNTRIRGERGHVILADEFNSIPIEIFDVVVRGFAATQLDPWEKVKARTIGNEPEDLAMSDINSGNKIILAGTAGYTGETFHHVYAHYQKIIKHNVKGAVDEHGDVFDESEKREGYEVDCNNYCIVRYPWEAIPDGMMEKDVIESSRSQMPKQLFDMEYNTLFGDDSTGFYKAKQIREATASPPNGFSVLKRGKPKRQYVMGVDPAKMLDRFAVTIIEVGTPHKLVYQWTAQKRKYSECAAHMRELWRRFNIVGINMDAGGGGHAVEEMLNMEKTDDGLEIRKPDEPKFYHFDDDSEEAKEGLRILNLQNFGSAWLDESNTLLQKNIEDRLTMFPVTTSTSALDDEAEDILFEVSELKKELSSITIVYTKTGKKSFDLKPPDERKEEGVKHKDRYSSFLLANYMAMRLDEINYDKDAILRERYEDDNSIGGWSDEFT